MSLLASTQGGFLGHLFRRCFHLSMALVPVFYYFHQEAINRFSFLSAKGWVVLLMLLSILFEVMRLKCGWRLFGQREREGRQVSSFAWGLVSLSVVLLLAPGAQFATAIIASCAFADPLLGELRRFNIKKRWVFFWGSLCVIVVWAVVNLWVTHSLNLLSIPAWWIFLMGPVTVLSEWPNIKWVDDNALMQLVPLGLVLFIMQ